MAAPPHAGSRIRAGEGSENSRCSPRIQPSGRDRRPVGARPRDPHRLHGRRLRLHERLPRHGERDGDDHRHARASAPHRRRPGGRAEPRRRLPLGRGRRHDRKRHRQPDHGHGPGDLRRPRRRDPLERDHVVPGHPVVVVARARRRRCRLGAGRGGHGGRHLERDRREGADPGGAGPVRLRAGRLPRHPHVVPAHPLGQRPQLERRVPLEPDPVELAGRARARHERRAEDDGRDRAHPRGRRPAVGRTPACRRG